MPSVELRPISGSSLRRIAVLLLIAGLFAMHGLPMAGAATPSMAMPSIAMSSAAMPSMAHVGPDVVSVPATHAPATAVMAGCDGTEHCTAVLRADDGPVLPALSAVSNPDATGGALHHVIVDALAARGPPPDLQKLGISRT